MTRFLCMNCDGLSGQGFESDKPVCARCGANGRAQASMGQVVPVCIMHWQRFRKDNPRLGELTRACDGGPLGDLAQANKHIKAWKTKKIVYTPRWCSTSCPYSVTCEACRNLEDFKTYLANSKPPVPILREGG